MDPTYVQQETLRWPYSKITKFLPYTHSTHSTQKLNQLNDPYPEQAPIEEDLFDVGTEIFEHPNLPSSSSSSAQWIDSDTLPQLYNPSDELKERPSSTFTDEFEDDQDEDLISYLLDYSNPPPAILPKPLNPDHTDADSALVTSSTLLNESDAADCAQIFEITNPPSVENSPGAPPLFPQVLSSQLRPVNFKPFIRRGFPSGAPNHTPIQGLCSNKIILRTCFRIAEALKVSSGTMKSGSSSPISSCQNQPKQTLVELYAIVKTSYRRGSYQIFRFADIFFPSRPPYLMGKWEGWLGNPYLDKCGESFLTQKHLRLTYDWHCANTSTSEERSLKLCRVVGVISSSLDGTVAIRIVNIQKAEWSDVEDMKEILEA
ncbi:hypothetical protein FQN57_004028 [Myotisia sp. PD_48]|nr:hypothetical protein FQN57_004028 [Myotisia sp. PD_48]